MGLTELTFGFRWDDVTVERVCDLKGHKFLRVSHAKTGKFVDIRVTPSGKKMETTLGQVRSKKKGRP